MCIWAIKEKGWMELCESVVGIKKESIKLIFAGEGLILDEIQNIYIMIPLYF